MLRFDRIKLVIKMIHFYVVRHGQTLFNVWERIQGWSDSPLTELGFNQAKALGKKLDISDFKAAYSSSSERALDTLDAVLNGRTMPIHATKGLKEVSFGVLEGEKVDDVFPDGNPVLADPQRYKAENRREAAQRFLDELKRIYDFEGDCEILVVSHGAIIREVLGVLDPAIQNSSESTFVLVPNCSISVISYDGKTFRLEKKPYTL